MKHDDQRVLPTVEKPGDFLQCSIVGYKSVEEVWLPSEDPFRHFEPVNFCRFGYGNYFAKRISILVWHRRVEADKINFTTNCLKRSNESMNCYTVPTDHWIWILRKHNQCAWSHGPGSFDKKIERAA